ncbi:MAG: LysM peptidoglycan-binding domain-containing protein [Candidatus Limnocylindria bacterium]
MDRVCPLLGLQGNRRTVIDGIDGAHRCHAEDPPIPLDRQQQARVCLTDAHERCERYLANRARSGGGTAVIDGLVPTRLVLAPDPAWRGIAGRARRAPAGPLLALGAAGLVVGIGGVAAVSGAIGGATPEPTPSASIPPTTPTPSPTALASTPTPSASPSPPPTIVPTAEPTPVVTPAPVVTAAPPPVEQTYVVQQGDTLAAIAQQFGTTVAALQGLNGIDDPNEIVIGQVLRIP